MAYKLNVLLPSPHTVDMHEQAGQHTQANTHRPTYTGRPTYTSTPTHTGTLAVSQHTFTVIPSVSQAQTNCRIHTVTQLFSRGS